MQEEVGDDGEKHEFPQLFGPFLQVLGAFNSQLNEARVEFDDLEILLDPLNEQLFQDVLLLPRDFPGQQKQREDEVLVGLFCLEGDLDEEVFALERRRLPTNYFFHLEPVFDQVEVFSMASGSELGFDRVVVDRERFQMQEFLQQSFVFFPVDVLDQAFLDKVF